MKQNFEDRPKPKNEPFWVGRRTGGECKALHQKHNMEISSISL